MFHSSKPQATRLKLQAEISSVQSSSHLVSERCGKFVIPANAGIQSLINARRRPAWMPAFAGMTATDNARAKPLRVPSYQEGFCLRVCDLRLEDDGRLKRVL
jgi:hypothetical protein